ncbi:MAG: LPS-assembly protein LptD, partial [Bacteroidia bacterium]
EKSGYDGELKYLNDFPSEYLDFNIPWSLTVSYTVNYNKYANLNNKSLPQFTQTLNYSGDFNLTKKWKIVYSSGYDFINKTTSFTSINITRDLHCWEFKFDWIPFGPRQSFLFTIKVKAAVLQELKQTRRREWYDRTI